MELELNGAYDPLPEPYFWGAFAQNACDHYGTREAYHLYKRMHLGFERALYLQKMTMRAVRDALRNNEFCLISPHRLASQRRAELEGIVYDGYLPEMERARTKGDIAILLTLVDVLNSVFGHSTLQLDSRIQWLEDQLEYIRSFFVPATATEEKSAVEA